MAWNRRVYITLNSDKEKDIIIEKFLSQSYSEADCIKEVLYRMATQGDNLKLININSTDKVQKITNSNKKVKNYTKPKGNNKVLKGADNDKELLKDDNILVNNMEQIETDNTKKVQINDNSDNEELNKNILEGLDRYF
ncbi:hypothetical protein [Clostridium beijerinckii]|jgi:hypothetical protein|uniref:Uncharacterized protein n=2 Tax=Clostridium beijerinckii TaxID=1520 RepID=A0AAE2RVP8_CLOBE|nr:hypothetical protein [Clostridium beijerinckii]ABR33531.1 hypothetical protein Cbei_1351 [Clostridium beijerinckii NCIMB 8052]AIU00829.1 hypothetical protein Cbs_1351 [Clostridium beijerinckii ATCC 35702]MBF7811564.1 hypothetical protein [Clostridium beijerinckii]MBF7811917.1 hypothetical protein [Clostridium beijerinckii]MBF7811945.1 hypothetical protein [Clostridium beijerinckii]